MPGPGLLVLLCRGGIEGCDGGRWSPIPCPGGNEAIYSLLMMKHGFVAASANIERLDPEADGMPIVLEREDDVDINCAISNSFGFGGTNATLAFQR